MSDYFRQNAKQCERKHEARVQANAFFSFTSLIGHLLRDITVSLALPTSNLNKSIYYSSERRIDPLITITVVLFAFADSSLVSEIS